MDTETRLRTLHESLHNTETGLRALHESLHNTDEVVNRHAEALDIFAEELEQQLLDIGKLKCQVRALARTIDELVIGK